MYNTIGNFAQQQRAGFKCPSCGAFIETSVRELLTCRSLSCGSCHLRLMIDQQKSRQAFDALRKVQAASINLERASKFG